MLSIILGSKEKRIHEPIQAGKPPNQKRILKGF
jgi:hypothetical protein